METSIAETATGEISDRRRTRRCSLQHHGIVSARIRPGHVASVIDVSADGVLLETLLRLFPGSLIEVQLATREHQASARGHVLRSSVSRLDAGVVCYRSAIEFDRHLPWFVGEHRSEYRVLRPDISVRDGDWARDSQSIT